MAMKDMNIAKLTSTDLPLFSGIIQDLFPGVETPVIDYGKVSERLRSIHSLCYRISRVLLSLLLDRIKINWFLYNRQTIT